MSEQGENRLWAVRGAVQAEANEAGPILSASEKLMRELLQRNELAAGDVVSCLFTVTDDLDAEFPAVAARRIGLDGVPLLCTREIPVPGSLPRVIRLLVHCYPPEGTEPRHVYLRDATQLRRDLESAQ